MMKPKCSIIIPTYNCIVFLGHAIDSVRLQGIDDIEIIVVDDGSTDGTDTWLRREARHEPRLRVLESGNKGPSFARNLGITEARSNLVAFLDADDFWWPKKLARQLAFHAANPQATFSFTDYQHVDISGRVHGTCFEYWKPRFHVGSGAQFSTIRAAEQVLLACNLVGTSTVVATRESLLEVNGFDASLNSAGDWDLWLRLAGRAPVAVSSAVTMNYLMRPNSITRNMGARISAMKTILARYEKKDDAMTRRACRLARARIDTAEAEFLRSSGDYLTSATTHARAFIRSGDRSAAHAAISDAANTLLARRQNV
jgi:glycosyltransferase involved in cell wall biosynthesis